MIIDWLNFLLGKHLFHTWKRIDRNHRKCIKCPLKEHLEDTPNDGMFVWREDVV